MSTTTCVISQNQPIYDALIAKASTYPVDLLPYHAKDYQKAAKALLTDRYNLYDVIGNENLDQFRQSVPNASIRVFIYDFVNKDTTPKKQVPTNTPTCAVAQNQPIYEALIAKAASYPTDKPYNAQAYKKAAESLLTYRHNLYDVIANRTWYRHCQALPNAGTRIKKFIQMFIEVNPLVQSQIVKNAKLIHCDVPYNQPIYLALLNKADSYSAEEYYQAKAYLKVAQSLLTYPHNIYDLLKKDEFSLWYQHKIPHAGYNIRTFIEEFVMGY